MKSIGRASLFGVSLSFSLAWHIIWFLVFKPVFNFGIPTIKNNLSVSFLGSILKRSDLYHAKVGLKEHEKIVSGVDDFEFASREKPKEPNVFNNKKIFHKPAVEPFKRKLFIRKEQSEHQKGSGAFFLHQNKNDIASAVLKSDFSTPSLFLLNEAISTAVKLKILISSRGDVINIVRKTSCGNPRIDLLIMRSVKSWYFLNPSSREKEWLEIDFSFAKD